MMHIKVTVDFLLTDNTPADAKTQLESILRKTHLPPYNIHPQTEVTSINIVEGE